MTPRLPLGRGPAGSGGFGWAAGLAAGLGAGLVAAAWMRSLEGFQVNAIDDPGSALTAELLSTCEFARLDVLPQRSPRDIQLSGSHRNRQQLAPLLVSHGGNDTDVSAAPTMIPWAHCCYNDTQVSMKEGAV